MIPSCWMFSLFLMSGPTKHTTPNLASLSSDSYDGFSHDLQLFFRCSAKEGNVIHFKRTPGNGHRRHLAIFGQWRGKWGRGRTLSYLLHSATIEKRQRPIEFTAINPEPLIKAACPNCKRSFCIFVINHSCRLKRSLWVDAVFIQCLLKQYPECTWGE